MALPRNLLKGFCNIYPLVEWAEEADRRREELRAMVRHNGDEKNNLDKEMKSGVLVRVCLFLFYKLKNCH